MTDIKLILGILIILAEILPGLSFNYFCGDKPDDRNSIIIQWCPVKTFVYPLRGISSF